MAWNADTTRMPYRMHSEYLRRLFLNNDLFEGRYQVEGRPVVLSDIRAPIFAVTTEADHVAPWRSVYKINLVSDTDVTFVLTSGGHNAGIVSEPGHGHRHFRVSRRLSGEKYVDPDTWYLNNPSTEGSWWPVWAEWLERKSAGRSAPPNLGAPDKGYLAARPSAGLLRVRTLMIAPAVDKPSWAPFAFCMLGRKRGAPSWQRIRYSRKMPVSESRSIPRESQALSKLSRDALS